MEISNIILALIVIYFLIVTMLVIGAISPYSSERKEPKNESTKKLISKLEDTISGVAIGILTGAAVVVYYNWTNCSFFKCEPLSADNYFNPWFPSAVFVVFGILFVLIFCAIAIWILYHRKE